MAKLRFVLDTCVMVAALRSAGGPARELLVRGLSAEFDVLVSTALLIEYEAVMTREVHLRAGNVTAGDVAVLIDRLAEVAVEVDPSTRGRPRLPDPNDEMVLEVAVDGLADGLVTYNVRDFDEQRGPWTVVVLSPQAALQKLREEEL